MASAETISPTSSIGWVRLLTFERQAAPVLLKHGIISYSLVRPNSLVANLLTTSHLIPTSILNKLMHHPSTIAGIRGD